MAADNAVAAERTKVESVELVLPPHANHQVSVHLSQEGDELALIVCAKEIIVYFHWLYVTKITIGRICIEILSEVGLGLT